MNTTICHSSGDYTVSAQAVGRRTICDVYQAQVTANENTKDVLIAVGEKRRGRYYSLKRDCVDNLEAQEHPNILSLDRKFRVVSDNDAVYYGVLDPLALRSLRSELTFFPDGLQETDVVAIMKEVAKGLVHLHQRRTAMYENPSPPPEPVEGESPPGPKVPIPLHNELSAACVFISDEPVRVKLGYLATVITSADEASGSEILPASVYHAPEIFRGLGGYQYSEKSDVFSLGVLGLEMAYGRIPIASREEFQRLVRKIVKNKMLPNTFNPKKKTTVQKAVKAVQNLIKEKNVRFSGRFGKMMKKCLAESPHERPTAAELLQYAEVKFPNTSVANLRMDALLDESDIALLILAFVYEIMRFSGRVRVAVRLRPRNAEEMVAYADFADCVELQPELKRLKLRKNNWDSDNYEFDESVLDGYNGTLMAFGQTGTGKTYTLGKLGDEDTSARRVTFKIHMI
ncbi:armadillo repeat kinesin 2 [Striga asiatica]|uniref:Armadillo repeat kinesin 2 n=1 Tax=Striga asiatica TaxID=4170 RepID=A0A5A7RJT0_STRAF|nr:armadillo repeat kinesin 2 [Striga asiatica]